MKPIHVDTEVVAEESRRDRRGRTLLCEERWAELFAGYEKSGQSQREYCREQGINIHTFVARLAKRRRERVVVGSAVGGFVEAKMPAGLFGSQLLEVLLPNGLLLRGSEPASLALLVRVLQGSN
jgi:hypothetical protein